MQFRIKKRDGPGRIGEFTIDKKPVVTPNIFSINTKRFKAPSFADVTLSNKDDLTKSDHLFVIKNALQLFQRSKNFVEFIVEIKESIGYDKAVYLPAAGEPVNFALLTYMGIDLFDSTSAIMSARDGKLFFSDGKIDKNDLKELPCNCPSCNKFKGKPSEMKFDNILNHNYYIILNEIKNVRNAISNGRLRGLVEARVQNDPHLISILRTLDRGYNSYLEKQTPVTSSSTLFATSKETFNRPEIKRFQDRVIHRYRKPKSTKMLLLLPCSAKKPYSFSQSHKLFLEKINSSGNPSVIHEVIITSPIGLVPRELELVYPASNYDIPVTGVWDEDEKKMIRNLLKDYLKVNKYDKIISHLPEEIMSFTKDILKDAVKTCIDKTTSKKSLDNLSKNLNRIVKEYEKVKYQERKVEDILGLASYQFDEKLAKKILENSTIKGKYPYQKIISNGKQLGMIVKERGLISLTLDGAKRIKDSKKYWIEIHDDFTLKGSVFAPGLKNCDESIRIGDEVIVLRKKELVGVGVAMMNGEEMKKANYGETVKIRHHI